MSGNLTGLCLYIIGMNTSANKFCHINKLTGLDKFNLSFVHFKKLMKIQFLKMVKLDLCRCEQPKSM